MKPHLRAILQVGVLGALFGFSSLGAEVSAGDAAHVVLLENVRIFDPSVGAFTKPTDILIRGDRIEVTGDLEPPEGPVERCDAAGRYALAGLWDSHVHLAFLTLQSNTTMSASLRAFVAKGITGVRDVGGPLETISTLSRRIESGEFVGPRVDFAGPLLSQPPLYEQLQGLNRSLPGAALPVESEAAIDSILDRLVAQGATMTKAINRWEPACFRHYLDAAEARSLRVVLDPGLPIFHDVSVDRALALGVKSIEHGVAPWPVVLREDLKTECDAFMASGQPCESGNELRFRIMALGKASVSQEKLATLADTWTRSGAYFCPTLLVNENWRKHPPPVPRRSSGAEACRGCTRSARCSLASFRPVESGFSWDTTEWTVRAL